MKPLLCLPLLLLSRVLAAPPDGGLGDVTLASGTVLKQAVVLKSEPDGLRLEHAHGVAKVKFEELPEALRQQYGFDPARAEAFRTEASRRAADEAAAERRRAAASVMEKEASQQEADVQRGREAFYSLLDAGGYNFAQVDKAMRDSIAILKEAGREDLAALLEEDRVNLRAREASRGNEADRREREQLLARIRDLEAQLGVLNQQPAGVAVVQDTQFIPFFVDRPIVVPTPVPCPVPPVPCPTPPVICPPTLTPLPIWNVGGINVPPATGVRPNVPPATGGRPVTRPVTVPQPNVPPATGVRPNVPPATGVRPITRPVSVPQPSVPSASGGRGFTPSQPVWRPAGGVGPATGGAQVTGAHQWQRGGR